jgi:alkylation response protein AidB-like acyl-CoA dehydrogenase
MNKSWADYFEQSFLGHVYLGHFHWELIKDFPSQESSDKSLGDQLSREVVHFIDEHLDEASLEAERKLPVRYLNALRKTIYPKLVCGQEMGGGALTHMNAFRVLQAAFNRSIPAGFAIGLSNAFGIASLIPALPECEFKSYVVDRVSRGVLSGWADTEPTGATNWYRSTKAVSADGGKTYVINGEKCYIGNGSIADVLIVSATIEQSGKPLEVALFAVDTRAEGFSVRKDHDFMGIDGSPISALSFKDVVVGRHQLLEIPEGHWREALLIEPLSALGRMFTVVAATTAISKRCLGHILAFQKERFDDGKPLAHYRKIQALTAKTAAEVFAQDSVVEWCLLGSDGPLLPNRWWEQTAAKNIASQSSSRIADRAISMLGAGGYEKAESKRLLGLADYPTEREYRDVRAFRISGAVDFMVDLLAANRWLNAFFYNENFDYRKRRQSLKSSGTSVIEDSFLSPKNLEHLNQLQTITQTLGDSIQTAAEKFTFERLTELQPIIILFNRIANEIFTLASTIAKARVLASTGSSWANATAEEYAMESMLKIKMWQAKLQNEIDLVEKDDCRRERIIEEVVANAEMFFL